MNKQDQINSLIRDIEKYTRDNKGLWDCHHFLFDLPLSNESAVGSDECIVMGMNPGETNACRRLFKKGDDGFPLEESSRRNDLLGNVLEGSSLTWHKKCLEVLNSKKIILGEMFFWSTPKDKNLYGLFAKEELLQHYKFCASINSKMIDIRRPKAIIFPGISKESLAISLYNLEPGGTKVVMDSSKRGKLLSFWKYKGIPWIFTKHWTGSRLSNVDFEIIKSNIRSLV